MGSIPGSGRSLVGGHGNSLQYSCLENPMERGAWRAIVHRVAKSGHDRSDFIHLHSARFSTTLFSHNRFTLYWIFF